jgi:UDP-N-acetylmuramyl tripeptide synthase
VALARLSGVDEVEGRFARTVRNGHPVRLLLAKNPAGWTAIFDLLEEDGRGDDPVVLSINARIADGFDTSWLWDVPFERLAGRPVVATGDRRLDLAVRLRYAEVPCTVVPDPLAALDRAMAMSTSGVVDRPGTEPAGSAPIDFLGNYTAFAELRSRL